MTVTRTHSGIVFLLAAWLAGAPLELIAQESVAQAKELYATAAYDEALAMLERLQASAASSDAADIAMYRVLCLFALGRSQDGQNAIAALVNAHPEYRPSDQTSPHIRTVFHQVRRRLLPQIVQRWYADARARLDRKEPRDAAAGFDRVIALLDDEDARDVPAWAEFRTLNVGFRDLSRTAAAAAEAAAAASAPAVTSAPAAPPASAAPSAPASRVYDETDATVVPPVVVSQKIPRWQYSPRSQEPPDYRGVLELIIDTKGHVESAVLRQPVHPSYDGSLIAAARAWTYRPATKDGRAVKYRRHVEIRLRAPGSSP